MNKTNRKIKFLDLKKINMQYKEQMESAFSETLESGWYISGSKLAAFENDFADSCEVSNAIGVSNGLDALRIIFESMVMCGKLKNRATVAVPANTFIASFLAVTHANLNILPVDIDPVTRNLNRKVLEEFKDRIDAVLFVHLYGSIEGILEVKSFCDENNIVLVEDAAQAHFAKNAKGIAGSFGDAAGFSFYPGKNLGALGDAGAITTNDAEIAETAKTIRNYGSKQKYKHEILGVNNRLDEMQAAFLSVKLQNAHRELKKRSDVARMYINNIKNTKIKLPSVQDWNAQSWHLFVVEVENRDEFQNYMEARGIETLIHYPIPCHKQACYEKEMGDLVFPITEKMSTQIVSLPISPVLSLEECDAIIDAVNGF